MLSRDFNEGKATGPSSFVSLVYAIQIGSQILAPELVRRPSKVLTKMTHLKINFIQMENVSEDFEAT